MPGGVLILVFILSKKMGVGEERVVLSALLIPNEYKTPMNMDVRGVKTAATNVHQFCARL